MRLIDADALQKAIENKAKRIADRNPSATDTVNGLLGALNLVRIAPTVNNNDTKIKLS